MSPVLLVARILLRIHFISKLYTFESVMRKITLFVKLRLRSYSSSLRLSDSGSVTQAHSGSYSVKVTVTRSLG